MSSKFWISVAVGSLASVSLSGCDGLSSEKIHEQENAYRRKQAELEAKMNVLGTVVYTVKALHQEL
ncbi:hypothetical protein BH10CYA1_BH10CYA1_45250 [soil metagenome]